MTIFIRHQYEFKTAECILSLANEDQGNYMSKKKQKENMKNLESSSF